MHVPDGFINAPVSAAAGVVAAGAVAVSLRGARRELDERTAPLAGLVAAFIFAVQMLNFPVAAGTSGHLLGGALAAILVGPYTGVLCVTVVLLMQGILFADGGLTALGVNVLDMGITTTAVAYALFRGLLKVLPKTRRSVTGASFVAALVSVPAAACVFTLIYWIGGTTDIPIGKVFTAMVGVHVLIGIGEALITALTVGAVIAVRPDLVHGARGLTSSLKLRVDGELVDAPARQPSPRSPPAPTAGSGPPAWSPPSSLRASSPTTPPPTRTAWRRSPPTRASTRRPRSTRPRTPRSPTTASRTSPTPGSPAASPESSASAPRSWSAAESSTWSAAVVRRTPPTTPRAPARTSDMGAGHAHKLYRHGHSPVHDLPPHCKIAAAFCFVVVVVSTPRESVWAFGLYAVLLGAVTALARIPAGFLLKRLLIEVPFVAFALLMPFVVPGEQTHVLGLPVSVPGLWGAWNVLAKGTLGVAASVLLASTTELRSLLLGLQRLKLPPLLVQIASFMIRYGDVITDEMRRMSIARRSRGFEARGVRQWGVLAKTAGALFIRSYERGERVHLAMVSRGYAGAMPVIDEVTASRAQWAHAAALPVLALAVCLLGWTL